MEGRTVVGRCCGGCGEGAGASESGLGRGLAGEKVLVWFTEGGESGGTC
jgi:hypothetical protein